MLSRAIAWTLVSFGICLPPVALAGSFSVTVIDDTTKAYVKSPGATTPGTPSITSGGDVNVVADSSFGLIGAAGALAIGIEAAGIGVGADVGVVTVRTQAYLGNLLYFQDTRWNFQKH